MSPSSTPALRATRRGCGVDSGSKAKRVAAKLPFAEDLLAAYYCAFDRATPLAVKTTLLGALAYFVLPFDFVPDVLPVIGYGDDAAVLMAALKHGCQSYPARASRGGASRRWRAASSRSHH